MKAAAAAADRFQAFDVENPVDDVERVMTEVGHLAAAVIPEPTEMINTAIRIVRASGRGSEEHIPIEFGRRVAVGRIADAGHDVAKEIALHADDIADGAVAEKIFGLMIMRGGTLLGADLDDAFVMRGDLLHPFAFFDEK